MGFLDKINYSMIVNSEHGRASGVSVLRRGVEWWVI